MTSNHVYEDIENELDGEFTAADLSLILAGKAAKEAKPKHFYKQMYYGLGSLADACEKAGGVNRSGVYDYDDDTGFEGDADLLKLCREGWRKYEGEAMEIADATVRMVETECEQYLPVFDVTGDSIDMGRHMAGMPEDMIDFPLMKTSGVGSVVTLCSDVATSGTISNESIKNRGLVIAGLAIALNRLGHSTELYVNDEYYTYKRLHERLMIRTLVKGTNDFIDPSRIMFAFCHPGMQRGINFTLAAHEPGRDGNYGKALRSGFMGNVVDTTKDLPEGTIYMPPMVRSSDAPNAQAEIRRYLGQLGLIDGQDD